VLSVPDEAGCVLGFVGAVGEIFLINDTARWNVPAIAGPPDFVCLVAIPLCSSTCRASGKREANPSFFKKNGNRKKSCHYGRKQILVGDRKKSEGI
jgi:hypothetical protein